MTILHGQIFRVAARMFGPDNQDIMNVFYFQNEFTTSMTDEDFVNDLVHEVTVLFHTLEGGMSSKYVPADISIDQVGVETGRIVVERNLGAFPWGPEFDPDASTDPLPSGVALLVRFTTFGVRTIGRKFLAGWHEGMNNSNGDFGSTAVGYASAFANILMDAILLEGTNYVRAVVYSKRSTMWVGFLSAVISAIPAYQRRRRSGVGS